MASEIKCSTCQKTFKTQAALKTHHKRMHGDKIEQYECPTCHKKMRYLKNFPKHYVDAHGASVQDAEVVKKTLRPVYATNTNIIESK